MSDIDDQPSKPVRVAQGSNGAINVLSDEEITSENNYGYSRTFPDGEGDHWVNFFASGLIAAACFMSCASFS